MLLSALAFTANVLLVRLLSTMDAANVWLISVSRGLVGLAMICTVYWPEFKPTHLWRNRKLIERGVAGGIGLYVTYLAIVKLGAGRATFINNTYVIWGALLAVWILRERLRASLVAGSIIALAGLALLTNVFAAGSHFQPYDLLAVAGALLSGWVVVTIRQLHATEHTSTIFAAQCAYAVVISFLPTGLTYQPLPPAAWAIMVAAGVTAGIGQLTMTRAFRDIPVGEGALLQMLVPLGIAAGGIAFFHERFSAQEAIGAALILGGTAFSALRTATPANAEAE